MTLVKLELNKVVENPLLWMIPQLNERKHKHNESKSITELKRSYYSKFGDDKKNWKQGEKWSKERERFKKQKNSLYDHYSILNLVTQEIRTKRKQFLWSSLENDYAKQMIRVLDFNGRDEWKTIVSVIVLTKLSMSTSNRLSQYNKVLQEYNVSHDFVVRTALLAGCPKKPQKTDKQETLVYEEADDDIPHLFVSDGEGKENTTDYGLDEPLYFGNDSLDDYDNFDYEYNGFS